MTTEEYQLQQLKGLLVDEIILARGINHMGNAVIQVEKYCHKMQDQIKVNKG